MTTGRMHGLIAGGMASAWAYFLAHFRLMHGLRLATRALIDAAEYGDTRVIEVLLAAGADVAAKCEYHG